MASPQSEKTSFQSVGKIQLKIEVSPCLVKSIQPGLRESGVVGSRSWVS